MDLYPLLKPLLFTLDAETAHNLTLNLLRLGHLLGLNRRFLPTVAHNPVQVMGLNFKNRVGLAAGVDKNGDYLDALADLGFGFIEIGTVTPRPQPGNPKPRLFRLADQQAIINRMGFNSLGVDHLLAQVRRSQYQGVLGINIGKNADTANERASDDYLLCLRKVYPVADYVAVNISSPNTQGLRALQQGEALKRLLAALKTEQQALQQAHGGRYVPLLVKIAPDLDADAIADIARLLLEFAIDGVIATNTSTQRPLPRGHKLAGQTGGLSGAPIKALATAVVRQLAAELGGRCPIIAAGGIVSADDAREKLQAGASLLQVYSGLIFSGPGLVGQLASHCPPDRQAI